MKRIVLPWRILAWLVLCGGVLATWCTPRSDAPGPSSQKGGLVLKDLAYTDQPSGPMLDLYLPDRHQPSLAGNPPMARPVIVAIHGGSWVGGSRVDYGPQLARLLEHGYALAVPDYTLARPGEAAWPRVLDDLREAVRWVRRHAADHGLDPSRVVAMGSGAGGQLAALLGTNPPRESAGSVSARVQAVVELYGPLDLPALRLERSLEHDPIATLAGSSRGGLLSSASPIDAVSPDDPPMLLIHGLDDTWVLPGQAERMSERLAAARVKHELKLLPGARHGFGLKLHTQPSLDLLPTILDFLNSVWQSSAGQ